MNIFIKVCESVAFMHSNKMIHRDIKPENILLDENLSPKLCDFGWSVELKKNEKRQTFCGTYEYMAPEIFESENYFSAVDVWSLGILLYELFHQRSPFVGNSIFSIYKNIIKENILFDVGFGLEAQDLVKRILILNPLERPTVKEILEHAFIQQHIACLDKQVESEAKTSIPNDILRLEEINTRKKDLFVKKNIEVKPTTVIQKIYKKTSEEEVPVILWSTSSKEFLTQSKLSNTLLFKTQFGSGNLNRIFKSNVKPNLFIKPNFNSSLSKQKNSSKKYMEVVGWSDTQEDINEEIYEETDDNENINFEPKINLQNVDFHKKHSYPVSVSKIKSFKSSLVPNNAQKSQKFNLSNFTKKQPQLISQITPSNFSILKKNSLEMLKVKPTPSQGHCEGQVEDCSIDGLENSKRKSQPAVTAISKQPSLINNVKTIQSRLETVIPNLNSLHSRGFTDLKGSLLEKSLFPKRESSELNKRNLSNYIIRSFKERTQVNNKKPASTSVLFDVVKRTLNNKIKSSEKLCLGKDPNVSNLYRGVSNKPSEILEDTHFKTFTKSNSIQTEKFKVAKPGNSNFIYSTSISNKIQGTQKSLLSKIISNSKSLLDNSLEECRSDSSGDPPVKEIAKTKVIVQNIFTDKESGVTAIANAKQNFNITINQYYQKGIANEKSQKRVHNPSKLG